MNTPLKKYSELTWAEKEQRQAESKEMKMRHFQKYLEECAQQEEMEQRIEILWQDYLDRKEGK